MLIHVHIWTKKCQFASQTPNGDLWSFPPILDLCDLSLSLLQPCKKNLGPLSLTVSPMQTTTHTHSVLFVTAGHSLVEGA